MHKNTGFTLIELLVVISIIALLSSVVVAGLQSARAKARFAEMMTELKQIETASQGYFSDNGSHAADVGTGVAPAYIPAYLRSWPTPPCAGWTYDWENWTSTNGFIGVSVRNPSSTIIYHYCTDRASVCSAGQGTNAIFASPKELSC